LVQKTNQFNLNGRRYTQAAWQAHVERKDAFVMQVEYQDKFGPLGKISVISGQLKGRILVIDTWVMSCRAFSRRIEHQCLRTLFDKYDAAEMQFDFQVTPRNGPLQEFFVELTGGPPESGLSLSKEVFERNCPQLFHEVKLVMDDAVTIAFSQVL
jgi:FkbH-like protein